MGFRFIFCNRSISTLNSFTIFLVFLIFFSDFFTSTAYDPLDPNGNITIKWDVMSWTPDGYVAVVTIFNYQMYRHIQEPGWMLGWRWSGREVIWSMVGAQTTEQGHCSRFKGSIPHCCKKDPMVVDLLLGTPYNQQIANCCRGGVVSTLLQDPANAASAFQIVVGDAGNSNKTVIVPKNFTLRAPGPGYTCGPTKIVKPTRFLTPDGRRVTQAFMTWKVTCTYSQFLARKNPACCVSVSSFYNKTIVPCPTCSCACRNNTSESRTCVKGDLASKIAVRGEKNNTPLVECSTHMCPIRVHWHLKLNYNKFWQATVTIKNLNYGMNYTQWTIVIQHPNFDNLTQFFGINFTPLTPHATINDAAMMWGIEDYNDVLKQMGPLRNVEAELLFRKDPARTGGFRKGWAFPRRVYFNGDSCILPPPKHMAGLVP